MGVSPLCLGWAQLSGCLMYKIMSYKPFEATCTRQTGQRRHKRRVYTCTCTVQCKTTWLVKAERVAELPALDSTIISNAERSVGESFRTDPRLLHPRLFILSPSRACHIRPTWSPAKITSS